MIQYSIPEQSPFPYQIKDEKEMYPLWEIQGGNQFVSSTWKIVHIVSPGKRNRFSGPDYKDAHILIQGELYMGDVELHISNPDWYLHQHDKNPTYNKVVLHVVSTISDTSIYTENKKLVETIHLPLHSLPTNSCTHIIDYCAESEIESVIKMGAYTRWLSLCKYFINEVDGLNRIIHFLDTRHIQLNFYNRDSFMKIRSISDISFNRLYKKMLSQDYEKGSRFPLATLKNRAPLIITIAMQYCRDPRALSKFTLMDLKAICLELKACGYETPGISYLNEIMGNIIFPLTMKFTACKSLFDEWYHLPVQVYGNCTKKLKQWGADFPRTFGLQQGVLYQIENCCNSNQAFQCPFINIEN
ncbi:MAG: DUF2851 family protein [Candidatus Marinimicrobia bacterium]|nr:DUF2851 family protein [Candidatus Neomarinimicrobiota bacterium]